MGETRDSQEDSTIGRLGTGMLNHVGENSHGWRLVQSGRRFMQLRSLEIERRRRFSRK